MRRKLWLIAIVAVLALALVLAAGCGSKKSTTSSATTPTQGATPSMSAADIVKAAQVADAKTTSGTIAADLSVAIKGDTAKLGATSAQLGAMLSKPITVHVEGSFQGKPTAADMTMTLGVGGQNIPLAIKATGGKGYIQYGKKWYMLPASALKSVSTTTTTATDPTAELSKTLGVDVASWNPTFTLIGTESVDSVDTSHIQLTADTTKAMDDIMKALSSPQFWSQAGSAAGSATGTSKAQVKQLEGIGKQLAAALQPKITDFKVDMWIGTADSLTHKATLTLAMTFGGQMAQAGLTGLDITGSVTMSNFNAPVTVTAPSGALPYKSLQKALTGLSSGLLGGAAATGL